MFISFTYILPFAKKHSINNQYIPGIGILIHVSTAKSICNEGLDYCSDFLLVPLVI